MLTTEKNQPKITHRYQLKIGNSNKSAKQPCSEDKNEGNINIILDKNSNFMIDLNKSKDYNIPEEKRVHLWDHIRGGLVELVHLVLVGSHVAFIINISLNKEVVINESEYLRKICGVYGGK